MMRETRSPPPYAELQAVTNFSFLRGGSHAEELVDAAKALGLSAIAVADHNTLAGAVRMHIAAAPAGQPLIIGARLNLQDAPSLLCFPKNRTAYGRLCRLLTLGQRRAGKGECELYLEDVAAHAEGQIFVVIPPQNHPLPLEGGGLGWGCTPDSLCSPSPNNPAHGNSSALTDLGPPRGRANGPAHSRACLAPLGDREHMSPHNLSALHSESVAQPHKTQGDCKASPTDNPCEGRTRFGQNKKEPGSTAEIIRFPPHPNPLPNGERETSSSRVIQPSHITQENSLDQNEKNDETLSFPLPPPAAGRGTRGSNTEGEGGGPANPELEAVSLSPQNQKHTKEPLQNSERNVAIEFEHQLRRIKKTLAAPLYLAVSHSYRGDDRARIAALDRLGKEIGIPIVATNDVLYHGPERKPLQDVLTCIREKCTIREAGLRLEANGERHLKSPAEMARLFKGFEDALTRTVEIAEACTFSLNELVYEYPDEPVPEGKTPQQHLEDLTWAGADDRFPEGVPDNVHKTLARELTMIAQLRYAPYFLTVHDIVRFAQSQNILCQGRGSAANSAVCYCLGITNVDPTEIDLLFERFISPERKEPPDIDVDFEHERREEVIQYIYKRYGRERAGLAATVISYRRRSAVRDVGKVMGLSEDTVSALAGTVWHSHEGGVLPDAHIREAGLDPSDPLLRATLSLAGELMGFPRHLSQHVGGFVLTRGPLNEVVPIGNAAMENRTVIEWDKDDLSALGLLKVDVLGLGMLTCIHKCFDLLDAHYGRKLTLASVPREDPAVYDMLCKADSLGVFQVESRAQMNMLPRLKPRCFYDLVIEVAIVRPGPIQGDMVHPYLRRRDGLEPEDYPAPAPEHGPPDELRSVLGKTKGVPLFQEQAMKLAMVAAKFSTEEVNQLRHAMATFRRRGTIETLHDKMVSRMIARGYDPEFAERCFNQIKGFGEYGFPESHAASFAHLVYVSSWLKCHYPAVFACGLLNSQPMGFYAPAQIVRCAREHGVEVRPVDVNHSVWDCTLEPGEDGEGRVLRLGFRQVDGLRAGEAEKIVVARRTDSPPPGGEGPGVGGQTETQGLTPTLPPQGGGKSSEQGKGDNGLTPSLNELGSLKLGKRDRAPRLLARKPAWRLNANRFSSMRTGLRQTFHDLHDLWSLTDVQLATLEKLAAADCFRSIGLDRRQALWEVRALSRAKPLPLFAWAGAREAGEESEVALPEMPLPEHVVNDYQTLRLSLKAHPMRFLRPRLNEEGVASAEDVKALKDGARITAAGVVLVRQRPGSAKGVVFLTVEDETGIVNSVVWPKVLETYRRVVMGARLILIEGRIQRHEDIIHLVAERLEDRTPWLLALSEEAENFKAPIAHADEVKRSDPGSAQSSRDLASNTARNLTRTRDTASPRRHPRQMRILPKSRDFH